MASLTKLLYERLNPDKFAPITGTGARYLGGNTFGITVGGVEVAASAVGDIAPGQSVILIRTPSGYVAQATSQAGRVVKRIAIDG